MASNIFFNGRIISVPGSYSETLADGLEQVGLGASGIVAVLGEAEGGRPAGTITEVKDLIRITQQGKVSETFRSGQLREVGPMLWGPAKDPDIQAGVQEMVAMKINPATQSIATLGNTYGDSIDLTSKDYGEFTKQVNVAIADGTNQGKLVTVIFEDVTESVDDLGGDSLFSLNYRDTGTGWDTATAQVLSGGSVEARGTRNELGKDGDMGTQLAANGTIEVVSASGSDTTQHVEVFGLGAGGLAAKETLALAGATVVVGTTTFSKVFGAKLKKGETTLGDVTVRASGGGATIFTLTAGLNAKKGMVTAIGMFAGGVITAVADGATVKQLVVYGLSATGAVVGEAFTLAGATPVVGLVTFSKITDIALADVEVARTVTLSGIVAKSAPAAQSNLLKLADFFNARVEDDGGTDAGFAFTLSTGLTTFAVTDLDVMPAAVNCLYPLDPGFKADLWAVIAWINQNSQYVTAAKASGATGGAPSNTTSPVYLAGGEEGTSTFAHWQAALNLLKQVRVNSVVVLTGDPAVHAALDAHCAYMCGIGRSERDGFAGLLNTGLTDVPSKTEIKAQIVDLNTRHIRVWGQAFERYNPAGERTEYLPPYGAALLAAMQAGSPVGTALTYKYMNVLSLRQHSSWNPTEDAEEMINAGLVFAENVEGVGRRIVRNVTTYLKDNNPAYVEGSVNEAANFASYTFRTNMEAVVGKKGFSGTINAAKGYAVGSLGLLTDEEIIVDHRGLELDLTVDVLEVSVQMAPVIPINFVKSTLHLVTLNQTAA